VIRNGIASQRIFALFERCRGVNGGPDAGRQRNQEEILGGIEQDRMEREVRSLALLGGKAVLAHLIEVPPQCIQLHIRPTARRERGSLRFDQLTQFEQSIQNVTVGFGLKNPIEDVGVHPVPL
jgi:hypothetical protein